jgi:hypothetical protein
MTADLTHRIQLIMEPKSLDQIGGMLVEASKQLRPDQRATFEQMMALARCPVGKLPKHPSVSR